MKTAAILAIVWILVGAAFWHAQRAKHHHARELMRVETRLKARVDSLARQTAANERAFLTILARIETKGWEPICVDGLLAAYDYERQRIINQSENEKCKKN